MNAYRTQQVLTIVFSTASILLIFAVAPAGTSLWKYALSICFAITFATRVVPLMTLGGAAGASATSLLKWTSPLALLLLAITVLHWPQWWALLGSVAAWIWAFATRRFAQP